MENESLDLKGKLEIRFPILFKVLGKNKLDWKSITRTFVKRHKKYNKRFEQTGKYSIVEASFYDIIVASMKGEQSALRLLDYIQKLFEELDEILSDEERKEIVDNLYGFLSNIDLKYLNFLGELSVLNLYKRRSGYKLLATEEALSHTDIKGTKIDFTFLDPLDGKKKWIEVVNIHLNEKNTISDDTIERLLTQKIEEKITITKIKANPHVYLVPVVWGQYKEIKPVIDYLELNSYSFFNTIIPVCFITFTDKQGNRRHRFGTLDTIIKDLQIEE